jgi:hypothetical protein
VCTLGAIEDDTHRRFEGHPATRREHAAETELVDDRQQALAAVVRQPPSASFVMDGPSDPRDSGVTDTDTHRASLGTAEREPLTRDQRIRPVTNNHLMIHT